MNRTARFERSVPVIRVHTAGPPAAAIFRDGTPLTVAAVFERSFYCRDDRDRWLCFLRDDLEPGPLHALSTNWPEHLRERVSEGQTLVPGGRGVLAAPRLAIECETFHEWRPPAFPPPNPSALRRAIPRLREAIRISAPEETVAGWALASRRGGDAWRCAMAEETLRALAALSRWLVSPREHPLGEAVRALVGLGPGLTPTGDDVLAGTLLALHALGMKEKAEEIAAALETCGPERTNRISLAHLRAAAVGWGAAPFHDLLVALPSGGKTLDGCIRRIDAIGHSSGWDILIGIFTALECHAAQPGLAAFRPAPKVRR